MTSPLRAIMMCVDYQDLLRLTLPYNIHHFREVTVVTDVRCFPEVKAILDEVSRPTGTVLTALATELFYANGATLNKWAALEWGLDQMGRHGWLCIMDADVLWPRGLVIREGTVQTSGGPLSVLDLLYSGSITPLRSGQLCTPLRRMVSDLGALRGKCGSCNGRGERWDLDVAVSGDNGYMGKCTACFGTGVVTSLPQETHWGGYPVHRNPAEWAGYSQIFHADDPHLGPAPWHQVNWAHAGGADSMFQFKWGAADKVRPCWECLHLGPAGQNWMGRATPLLDGTIPVGAAERLGQVGAIWPERRRRQARGQDPYAAEKLPPSE